MSAGARAAGVVRGSLVTKQYELVEVSSFLATTQQSTARRGFAILRPEGLNQYYAQRGLTILRTEELKLHTAIAIPASSLLLGD